jgi:hypothetical protein
VTAQTLGDWIEDDDGVILGTIERRRQRALEPRNIHKREAKSLAAQVASWREASAYVPRLIADLQALRATLDDDTRSSEDRSEADARVRDYWSTHQEAAAARASRAPKLLAGAGWVRVSEAAKLSGLPPRSLRRWCEDGHLPAKKRGAVWYVSLRHLKRATGEAEFDE